MEPVPSTITKNYPKRGPLQQFRFSESTAFRCFRCGEIKKSKLIATYANDWSARLCNGCYGYLLSLFEIKAGTNADDQKVEELATALLSALAVEEQRQAERLYRAAEERAEKLGSEAVRFIATSEHVAKQLQSHPNLEWSPAVIGLCKAVESEVVRRIMQPLARKTENHNLSIDRKDKDIGRIATFCADPSRKPPELGTFAHFLQTAIYSQERRSTSTLLDCFLQLAREWPGSNWLLHPNGFHHSLTLMTTNFRNRAAHIDELNREDYLHCRELVIGTEGLLWMVLLATGG